VLSPVASQPAVPHGMSIDDDVFRGFSYTMTHNLTGWPAAVVRCGTSKSGLPIGVQIAANPWREDVTLAIARVLEGVGQVGNVGNLRPIGNRPGVWNETAQAD
jgi:amidase